MNKLTLLIFIVSIGLFACGEATTDRDETTTTSTDAQEMQTDQQKDRSVEQIINHTIKKLDERMSLSPETRNQIKGIYTNAYVAQGKNLNDQVRQDEISDLRKEIATQTEHEVMALLDENQRKTYKQVFEER